jgi:hypothetical protein
LENGRKVILQNVLTPGDETSYTKYNYKGFEKHSRLHWFIKELYDEQKHVLIDAIGDTTEVQNEPIVNQAGTLFLVRQNDCYLVFDDCVPGFQIWRVQNGRLSIAGNVMLENFVVVRCGWKTNSKFIVELAAIALDSSAMPIERRFYELAFSPRRS